MEWPKIQLGVTRKKSLAQFIQVSKENHERKSSKKKKSLKKVKDPRDTSITCDIYGNEFHNVFIDLGSRLNIIASMILKQHMMGKVIPTSHMVHFGDGIIHICIDIEGCCFKFDFIIIEGTLEGNPYSWVDLSSNHHTSTMSTRGLYNIEKGWWILQ